MYIICQSTCVEDKLKKKYGNDYLKDHPYDIEAAMMKKMGPYDEASGGNEDEEADW